MGVTQAVSGITIKKPDEQQLETLGVTNWPIWEKEPSTFDWIYESEETCFFLEGAVTVRTTDGEVSFGKGDLVTFPKGLHCTWEVKQPVRKHYRFS